MKNFKCYVVAVKTIEKKDKKHNLLWVTLYDEQNEFVDLIKLWQNKNLKFNLGDEFYAKKGYNQKTRETFLYDITSN